MVNILWRVIFYLLVSSLIYAQENTTVHILSSRLGEVIDKSERDYFGLFPLSEKFYSAKTIPDTNGRIRLTITSKTEESISDTTIIINAEKAQELTDFIDDFEMILRKEKKVRWDLIGDLALVPKFTNNDNAEVTITERGGRQQIGKMLYATDSLIVLWQSADSYHWSNLNSSGKIIHFSVIEEIAIEREGHFWSGLGYGGLIGGLVVSFLYAVNGDGGYTIGQLAVILGAGIVLPAALLGGLIGAIGDIFDPHFIINGNFRMYKSFVPELRKVSLFPSFPPLELKAFNLRN